MLLVLLPPLPSSSSSLSFFIFFIATIVLFILCEQKSLFNLVLYDMCHWIEWHFVIYVSHCHPVCSTAEGSKCSALQCQKTNRFQYSHTHKRSEWNRHPYIEIRAIDLSSHLFSLGNLKCHIRYAFQADQKGMHRNKRTNDMTIANRTKRMDETLLRKFKVCTLIWSERDRTIDTKGICGALWVLVLLLCVFVCNKRLSFFIDLRSGVQF